MSLSQDSSPAHLSPPKIRIQSASPEPSKLPKRCLSYTSTIPSRLTPRRAVSFPVENLTRTQAAAGHKRKRSSSPPSPSGTETQLTMTGGSSRSHSGSSRSHSGSSKKQCSSPVQSKKSKSGGSDMDWTDVKDPEERRRIQNRIAQRKFREKTRENKEKAEREMRNQQHAGNSYRIPSGEDLAAGIDPPWGGFNLPHCIARGHEAESRRSSGRGTYTGEDGYSAGYYGYAYGHGMSQADSYGSSGGDDPYYEEGNYGLEGYDPNLHGYPSH